MTQPRKTLVSVTDTPYYHIVSRCVRRTFLCGYDQNTDTDYEHRRQWIVDRIRILSSLFAVDICAFAVMSNHYHLVIKLLPDQLDELTDDEVIDRWLALYRGSLLVQQYRAGKALSLIEQESVSDTIATWRKRLCDLSWFMKCLNEPVARQANLEDDCTGHFWESRFKSQALRTEEALLTCMAYVDLNPIRADIATTPENSDYTSIQERITPTFDLVEAIRSETNGDIQHDFPTELKPLLPFDEGISNKIQTGIPFTHTDYLALVDWTGRAVLENKPGFIPDNLPPILDRLTASTEQWLVQATEFEAHYRKKLSRRPKYANTG